MVLQRLTDDHPRAGASLPHLVCVLLLFAIAGCSSTSTPPASTSPGAPATTSAPDSGSSTADTTQAPVAGRKPATDSATLALLQQSERAENAGSVNEAIAYTERAIRISPRDPQLWIRLAALENANTRHQSAIQYANKALSLAGNRTDYQREAWLVIADAKAALGDTAEAAEIRKRWQTYRG